MVELNFAGKKHISLKRASEITGYARDYIGQLCRQQKIKGQLVGRSWFVNLEELVLYKKQQEEIVKTCWSYQKHTLSNSDDGTTKTIKNNSQISSCESYGRRADTYGFWSIFKLTTLAAFLFFTFYFLNFTSSTLGGFEKQLDFYAQRHVANLIGVFDGPTLLASVEFSLQQGALKEVDNIIENNFDILSGKIQETLETVRLGFGIIAGKIHGVFISSVKKNKDTLLLSGSQKNKNSIVSVLPSQENSAGYFIVVQEEPYDLLWLVYVAFGVLSVGLVSNIYFKHRTNGFDSSRFNI